jgi:hypothetical protein
MSRVYFLLLLSSLRPENEKFIIVDVFINGEVLYGSLRVAFDDFSPFDSVLWMGFMNLPKSYIARGPKVSSPSIAIYEEKM